MDIHPPIGPTHSLKDFAIHILIVTIGILIALGLEGVREVWNEQKEVNETRASFQRELRSNQEQLKKEMAAIETFGADVDQALEMLPDATRHPDALTVKVAQFNPGLYFFKTTAWDAAVASGVLTHMNEDELGRFDEAYQGVRKYQDTQNAAEPEWFSAKSWFASHRAFASADLVTGEEKLRSLEGRAQMLKYVGGYFTQVLNEAVGP